MKGQETTIFAAALLMLVGSCEPSQPCDTGEFLRCSGGNVWLGGCVRNEIVDQCSKGCVEEGSIVAHTTCPRTLCRENAPKQEGASCQDATDCQPTVATVSSTAVENTYLTCDAVRHTCVPTDAPVVADWLAPCSPAVVAEVAAANGQARGYDGVLADSGCAEGWCAVHHVAGASCIASACTRACAGDHECPRGSTCANAAPAGCGHSSGLAHCKPGGPAAIGFTCG